MGDGEGEPDRPAAAEEMLGVGPRLVVAEHSQGRGRRHDRGAAKHQVEGDHVAVGQAQSLFQVHRCVQSNQIEIAIRT
jgi:hypothetical protein